MTAALVGAALVVGVLVPAPPAAASPSPGRWPWSAPDACASAPVPTCVFRGENRPPAEIFEKGFEVPGPGWNSNLLDHVNGRSLIGSGGPGRASTAFVSTTSSPEFVRNWAALRFGTSDEHGWVYSIAPDDTFVPVGASLAEAAKNGPREARAAAAAALKTWGAQQEWSARDGVKPSQVQSAVPVKMVNGLPEPVWSEAVVNSGFVPPATTPDGAPYPITEATCVPGSAALVEPGAPALVSCVVGELDGPVDAAALDDEILATLHGERGAAGGQAEFTMSLETVATDESLTLAPLPRSTAVFAEFERSDASLATFASLSEGLTSSLGHDLAGLERASTDRGFAARVTTAARGVGPVASEILPYVGIALTGYALSEDAREGRWVDAGFDATVEGLQVLEAAAPEAAPVVEPLVMVVVGLQTFWDTIVHAAVRPVDPVADATGSTGGTVGTSTDTAAVRERLALLEGAPALLGARYEQGLAEAVSSLADTTAETVGTLLTRRLDADRVTLSRLYEAGHHDIVRAWSRAEAAATSDDARRGLAERRDAALRALGEAVARQAETRRTSYHQLGADVLTVAGARLLAPDADGHPSDVVALYSADFQSFVVSPYLGPLGDHIYRDARFDAEGREPGWSDDELRDLDAAHRLRMDETWARVTRHIAGVPLPDFLSERSMRTLSQALI